MCGCVDFEDVEESITECHDVVLEVIVVDGVVGMVFAGVSGVSGPLTEQGGGSALATTATCRHHR